MKSQPTRTGQPATLENAMKALELASIYAEDGAMYTASQCAQEAAIMFNILNERRLEMLNVERTKTASVPRARRHKAKEAK